MSRALTFCRAASISDCERRKDGGSYLSNFVSSPAAFVMARLVQRWRHTIARDSARDWCRYHLSLHWEEPRDYPDQALARDCFLYLCRLLVRPTARILRGVHTAIEAEFDRWKKILA